MERKKTRKSRNAAKRNIPQTNNVTAYVKNKLYFKFHQK